MTAKTMISTGVALAMATVVGPICKKLDLTPAGGSEQDPVKSYVFLGMMMLTVLALGNAFNNILKDPEMHARDRLFREGRVMEAIDPCYPVDCMRLAR